MMTSSLYLYFKTNKELTYQRAEFILNSVVGGNFQLTWDGKFGTIVLEHPNTQYVNLKINYDALCSDLMDDLTFVIVPRFEVVLANLVKEKCNPGLYPFAKLLPHLLHEDHLLKDKLLSFKNEVSSEILETIKAYLELNMSVNMVSRTEYAHRNTVNYRISRFIELTGIDIRSTLNGYYVYTLITWDDPVYNIF